VRSPSFQETSVNLSGAAAEIDSGKDF